MPSRRFSVVAWKPLALDHPPSVVREPASDFTYGMTVVEETIREVCMPSVDDFARSAGALHVGSPIGAGFPNDIALLPACGARIASGVCDQDAVSVDLVAVDVVVAGAVAVSPCGENSTASMPLPKPIGLPIVRVVPNLQPVRGADEVGRFACGRRAKVVPCDHHAAPDVGGSE